MVCKLTQASGTSGAETSLTLANEPLLSSSLVPPFPGTGVGWWGWGVGDLHSPSKTPPSAGIWGLLAQRQGSHHTEV